MEQIYLREARKAVDKIYVGFTPNGSSIKPVHIAGGSLRCIYGSYNRTKNIKRMALVSDAKGNIPAGWCFSGIRRGTYEPDEEW